MARYEHLTIFKTAMDLTVYIEEIVRNFSRYHKYTIGTRLREKSWDIVELIIRVNNMQGPGRVGLLIELRDTIEHMNATLMVAKEIKAFVSYRSYIHAAKAVNELGRQGEGWLKAFASMRPLPESSSHNPRDVGR